jgi:pyruvyltransferase
MNQSETVNISWWNKDGKNWGDALNPVLAKHISGKNINWVKTGEKSNEQRYYCIGSILQSSMSEGSEIWGTGLMRYEHKLKVKPKKIHAVRGPLTRDSLIEQGFDCPEVYGDPALLYPRFYNPMHIKKKHKIGIIPHYIDAKNPWIQRCKKYGVKIINILDPVNKVVDEILECEKIAASCLHGIIAADAYGVPSTWIELSDKVHGKGFKFRDYFMSVGRKDREPLRVNETTKLKEVYNQFYDYKIDIDLDLLYNACPFKQDNI